MIFSLEQRLKFHSTFIYITYINLCSAKHINICLVVSILVLAGFSAALRHGLSECCPVAFLSSQQEH